MMTRRALLAAFAGALVVDPEKLLWNPRRKLISIPKHFVVRRPMRFVVRQGQKFHPEAFALVSPRVEIDSVTKLVTRGWATGSPIELNDVVTCELKGRILYPLSEVGSVTKLVTGEWATGSDHS